MTTDASPFESPGDRARELQLDALLAEAAGVLPAPGLVDSVLDAIAGAPATTSAGRRRGWMVAAAALLGLGVVGGVAWLQRESGEAGAVASPQEPEKEQPPKPTTLIADYSDNRVFEIDADGKVVFQLENVFGAWDAERLANGNYLIIEFSVSRVTERTPDGKIVWIYEGLRNPYDADLLPNGNVLIADTFGNRVIEVQPDRRSRKGGEIVWSYGKAEDQDIRPFDAERLDNGRTLIADILGNCVLEVDRDGKVVWQLEDLRNVHDVDRLPNGNTLVTLRSAREVREYDPDGKVVWRLKDLASPSDADRLSNGHTLVAEVEFVREFDLDGKVVWEHAADWAVEANRYPR